MSLPDFVSVNGEICSAVEARVCVLTPALLNSFGIYESVRVERGVPFHLEDHLERLAHSAALIDLPLPASPAEIGAWAWSLLAQTGALRALLRIVALGPIEGNGPLCALWLEEAHLISPAQYCAGVAVITVQGARYLPEAKSLNTLLNFMARRQAGRQGVHEALLCQGGMVTEGASSNFFVIAGESLLTPPADLVLSGVTRALVLRLANEAGIPCTEERLYLTDRVRWREAFITSTNRKMLPVTLLDGQPVGDGQVGPLTGRLMKLLAAHDREYLRRHAPDG
jgi:branched-subunit amino acid aminotransferase/4-amino-4-deoxychorismate lyase